MSILMMPNEPFKKCVYEGRAERTKPAQLCVPHIEPDESTYPNS